MFSVWNCHVKNLFAFFYLQRWDRLLHKKSKTNTRLIHFYSFSISGRRRLSDYHEETRHVSPRREEDILQTTGCDNNCSSSSQSYQQQPNPSKSSNSEEQRSLGPCSTTTKVYNTQESSQFSQLQLCLLYLVLVTLISCTGEYLIYIYSIFINN